VFTVGVFWGTETFTWPTLGNLMVVTAGVIIAAYGEINFVLVGHYCQPLLHSRALWSKYVGRSGLVCEWHGCMSVVMSRKMPLRRSHPSGTTVRTAAIAARPLCQNVRQFFTCCSM